MGWTCGVSGTWLNVHLGSSGKLAITAPDAPMDVMITLQPMNICMAAADLVWSRVFKEFPTLRVALFRQQRPAVNRALKEVPGVRLGDGAEVRLRARVDFWPPAGRLQLVMTGIDPADPAFRDRLAPRAWLSLHWPNLVG